jgi:hypothetical protein
MQASKLFVLVLNVKMTAEIPIMQIDVDIGSSSVARSVIGLVLGYVTSIVVDLAILIEVCPFLLLYLQKKYSSAINLCSFFGVHLRL